MDFQKMKYFIEIVEKGSVSQAAISLNMTQPPLSLAIKKLEHDLNVELFVRRGRNLQLTGTGQLFYTRAKELIDTTEEIMQEIVEHHQGLRGTIKIGCSAIVNLIFMPKVIEKLNALSLDYVIHVTEGNASFILDSLRKNEIDIGIVRSVFKKEDILSRELFSEPLMLALPPNHRLSGKKGSIKLGDLRNERFLMQSTTYGYNISELIIKECGVHGFYPNIVYWGTETLPMLSMVQKGLGVAVAPKSFSEIENFTLPEMVELDNTTLRSILSVVTYNKKIKKASANKFIDALEEVVIEMKEKQSYLS